MSRTRRHHLILSLLRQRSVESQDMLQGLLADHGVDVNQATLSRDLRALGVVKEPLAGGGGRYRQAVDHFDESIGHVNLRAFVYDIARSRNLLVIKTRIGGAQPVALAIDNLQPSGIIGTIAGDDTVLAVVAEDAEPKAITEALWALIEKGHQQ